ncbi:DNA polymerase III subunit beta [Carboxydochorda subterranea]|uniref:Beta sliding clamp n=1 Tax=Carboxydichorda subterranea TaxID=3109565 RepID=A0ABZ1BYF4_9FIRM|nr:DNA polymerase III subunit beta [Limnochorda sp. L945t]WRP17122.1 DNA polymerase III subunit beta [Limnochorda sp. L945t]
MEITCARQQLADALAIVERAAATRENVPVLNGILVEASPSGMSLRATDLELSIAAFVEGQPTEQGARVVDARLFSSLVRRLSGEMVRIATVSGGTSVVVESGGARFSLVSVDSQEFPAFPELADGWRVVMGAQALYRAIAQSRFAAASSDQRPVLSGVLVEVEGESLRLVATDSSRLAYREVSVDRTESFGNVGLFAPRVILPVRALEEMQRVCSALDGGESVALELGERLAVLRSGAVVLVSRLIEGTFPPYRQVFVENLPNRVRFRRLELLEAVQRAALLSRRGPAVVQLSAGDGRLVVKSKEQDVAQGEEVLEASTEGEAFEAAYQVRFLEDVLKAFDTEEMAIEVGDPSRQATVRVPGDGGYRYVLMPVRLG